MISVADLFLFFHASTLARQMSLGRWRVSRLHLICSPLCQGLWLRSTQSLRTSRISSMVMPMEMVCCIIQLTIGFCQFECSVVICSIFMYVCVQVHMYVCIQPCIYIIHVCMYVFTGMYVCMYLCITFYFIYNCLYVGVYVMYVCICIVFTRVLQLLQH